MTRQFNSSGLYRQVKYALMATKKWPLVSKERVVSEVRSILLEKLLVHPNCGLT